MALTLESAARLLDRHGLLREIIRGDVWTLDPHDIKGFDEPFSAITYDTRTDGFRKTSLKWRHYRYEKHPGGGADLDLFFLPLMRTL